MIYRREPYAIDSTARLEGEMINWFHYLLITLVAVTGSFQITRAQLPSEQGRGLNRPALIGSVESSEGHLRLNLANQDPAREFRGKARISLGTSEQQTEVARFDFSLAPQESRLFPLDSRGISSDRFTLEVYDQIGVLILLNNAPINRVTDTVPIAAPPTIIAPAAVTPSLNGAKELTVKARLVEERSSQPRRRDIEAPISDETGPAVLSFEIAAPAPIINASLSLRAKEYNDRRTINVHGSASVEFKLPEDFNEQKLTYALTNSSGLVVASGEVRLEELRKEDSVSVSDIKLDKTSYAPGESAQLVMTLEGRSPSGYRMEVTAKDADNATILQD